MTALRTEDYDKAELFANRGLRVRSNSKRMRSLRREIDVARAEAEAVALAEAELARIAAEAALAARTGGAAATQAAAQQLSTPDASRRRNLSGAQRFRRGASSSASRPACRACSAP